MPWLAALFAGMAGGCLFLLYQQLPGHQGIKKEICKDSLSYRLWLLWSFCWPLPLITAEMRP